MESWRVPTLLQDTEVVMLDSNPDSDNNSGEQPEKWYCPKCGEFRYLDGDEGYRCDHPVNCPSDSFGNQNCGYVVCSDCHSPLSDRHLAPGVDQL